MCCIFSFKVTKLVVPIPAILFESNKIIIIILLHYEGQRIEA